MKRTVKLSLGMSFIMLTLVLIAPHLASPKLVLYPILCAVQAYILMSKNE